LSSRPAACAIDAAPCLRSCTRIGGSLARNASHRNTVVIRAGVSPAPSSAVHTRPLSVRVPPQRSCSAAWGRA